jgi:hypothetical protein
VVQAAVAEIITLVEPELLDKVTQAVMVLLILQVLLAQAAAVVLAQLDQTEQD